MMTSPAGPAEQTIPLDRLYNNGQGGSPTHRYTIDPAVRAAMIRRSGYRGQRPDGVFACVPLTTSLPPPTGSPFQQDVMYYAKRFWLRERKHRNIDQISMILSAGIGP